MKTKEQAAVNDEGKVIDQAEFEMTAWLLASTIQLKVEDGATDNIEQLKPPEVDISELDALLPTDNIQQLKNAIACAMIFEHSTGANPLATAAFEAFENLMSAARESGGREARRRIKELSSDILDITNDNDALLDRVKELAVVAESVPDTTEHDAAFQEAFQAYLHDKLSKPEEHNQKFPDHLPQATFLEARSMATAISDGHDLRSWAAIDGALALLHAPAKAYFQTRFEPSSLLLGWWDRSSHALGITALQAELKNLEQDAQMTFIVCLSGVIKTGELDISLDEIITAIERDVDARRSKEARALWRSKVWRWLLIFDSFSVIGARPGRWKEPSDGKSKTRRVIEPQTLYSSDALFKIIGRRGIEQGTLDNSAVPQEVTLVAGPWVRKFRGNREILSDFGDLKAITAIRRGTPSGSWAACIGLSLQQKWREKSSKAPVVQVGEDKDGKKRITQRFPPVTRRQLIDEAWRSDHDVMEILESDKPGRAKDYWQKAIKELQKLGVIGYYKEIDKLPAGYEWQQKWLDQKLDIRPGTLLRVDAVKIRQSAQQARKRGKKKPAKSAAGQAV
jgi:hypothetical protein